MAEETQSTETQEAPAAEVSKEDYKAKYEELQSKHQKTVEELQSTRGTIDALDQYGAINWNAITGEKEPTAEPPNPVDQKLRQIEDKYENQMLILHFRQDYPDLREYEDSLVGPAIVKARHKNPRANKVKLLELAAEDVRNFLKTQEEKVLAKQKSEKVKDDATRVSGLESAGATPPKNEPTAEELNQEYIKKRRETLNKKKGLI
jgi:hypothetical protein